MPAPGIGYHRNVSQRLAVAVDDLAAQRSRRTEPEFDGGHVRGDSNCLEIRGMDLRLDRQNNVTLRDVRENGSDLRDRSRCQGIGSPNDLLPERRPHQPGTGPVRRGQCPRRAVLFSGP